MSNSTPDTPDAGRQSLPNGAAQRDFSSRTDLRAFVMHCAEKRSTLVPGPATALPPEAAAVHSFFCVNGMNQVLEHSVPDQVISVETGISIGQLSEHLQKSNQWFPVPPALSKLSLMELINEGEAGSLEHRFGGLRELILGVDVLLAAGEFIKCGGKVVKNVTGYDLTKLFVGSGGTLGIPVAAHLRLFALPEQSATCCYQFPTLDRAYRSVTQLLRAGLPLSCVELTDGRMVEDSASSTIFLCVQMHGVSGVLDELLGAAADIVGGAGKVCGSEEESQLWQRLNKFRGGNLVTVQSSCSLLIRLLDSMITPSRLPPWSLRPGANKLLLQLPAQSAIEPLLDDIRALCRIAGVAAEVCCGDRKMLRRVHRLPQEDSVRNGIALQIKQRYDPAGIFNPLVTSL